MPICELCGNAYEKTFEVFVGGKRHIFDSFECAIQTLDPQCPQCGCRIMDMGSKRMDEFSAAPIALAATEAPTLKTANNSRAAGQ